MWLVVYVYDPRISETENQVDMALAANVYILHVLQEDTCMWGKYQNTAKLLLCVIITWVTYGFTYVCVYV